LISSQVGRIDPALAPRWDRERRLALATDLLDELTLAELITHRFAFSRAAEAYTLLDGQANETVQVVLDYA
jgi:threonine dehydrogenase-like Zn-dependent dehydrogenase